MKWNWYRPSLSPRFLRPALPLSSDQRPWKVRPPWQCCSVIGQDCASLGLAPVRSPWWRQMSTGVFISANKVSQRGGWEENQGACLRTLKRREEPNPMRYWSVTGCCGSRLAPSQITAPWILADGACMLARSEWSCCCYAKGELLPWCITLICDKAPCIRLQ